MNGNDSAVLSEGGDDRSDLTFMRRCVELCPTLPPYFCVKKCGAPLRRESRFSQFQIKSRVIIFCSQQKHNIILLLTPISFPITLESV